MKHNFHHLAAALALAALVGAPAPALGQTQTALMGCCNMGPATGANLPPSLAQFDVATLGAHVALSTTITTNDTATGTGTANSRVLSNVRCPQGSQCRFDWIPNYTDGGASLTSIGVATHSAADGWIGASGPPYPGAVMYGDGVVFQSPSGNVNVPALASVSGVAEGVEIDNSTPASPVVYFIQSDGFRRGPYTLPANNDFYVFFEAETGGSGKGGRVNFGPTWLSAATAGYGPLS